MVKITKELVMERGQAVGKGKGGGNAGSKDPERLAIFALRVGESTGIAPNVFLRDRQRTDVPELQDYFAKLTMDKGLLRVKSGERPLFVARINSATNAAKTDHGMRVSTKTYFLPIVDCYADEAEQNKALAEARQFGFIPADLPDEQALTERQVIPVILVERKDSPVAA